MACRQQRYPHQQTGYCSLDFVAKRRTKKRSNLIVCNQQSIAHQLGT